MCRYVSLETAKVVWYSYLLKNFPQFVVIHTVKGFSIVNEAEEDVFLKFPCFFHDPTDAENLVSDSSTLSKSSLYSAQEREILSLRIVEAYLERF